MNSIPKTCKISGCEKSGRIRRGWCQMHYCRYLRHGNLSYTSREFHGYSGSKGMVPKTEYRIWQMMKNRCYNPKCEAYKNYGGRGIEVCDRWLNSFSSFLEDMGTRPSYQYTLDRKDNNLGYSTENCQWATRFAQTVNRRKRLTNTSGYIGVEFQPKNSVRKWMAQVTAHGISYRFGYYEDPLEAAYVRDQVALQIHGDNATLNLDLIR